ncbi:MAG: thioredoxin domain-containing protein [Candidatus Omnitrophica bacterium]|nr:thioredoxin domain-containing protein [Candidatus Omnitrophota bacterium]
MENKYFTLIVTGILAVVISVGIVSKQAKDPMLRQLLKQQADILGAQQRVEKHLTASQQPSFEIGPSAQFMQKYQTLEQRVAALEAQLRTVQATVQQAQAQPPQPPPGPPPEDFTTVYTIPVTHTPVIGQKNAPVTLVEFIDFQCPFCSRFHAPMVEAVKADPGKVNYMIKNYPLSFHPQAKPAAKAALAAGEQGKYAEMATALLENNQNRGEELFKKLAKDIGLNVDKVWKDYQGKDAQWEKYLQDDIDLGNQVGVRGTPTFYINGRKTNARDAAGWKAAVDQALKEKK